MCYFFLAQPGFEPRTSPFVIGTCCRLLYRALGFAWIGNFYKNTFAKIDARSITNLNKNRSGSARNRTWTSPVDSLRGVLSTKPLSHPNPGFG